MTPGEAAKLLALLGDSEPFMYVSLPGSDIREFRLAPEQREALALAVTTLTAAQQAENAR